MLNNNEIQKDLADIRQKIAELHMPKPAYAGIAAQDNQFCIAIVNGEHTIIKECIKDIDNLIDLLKKHAAESQIKIIAAGVEESHLGQDLTSSLWLNSDIVPLAIPLTEASLADRASYAASSAASFFDANNLPKVVMGPANEVIPSRIVTLKDYERTVSPLKWQHLLSLTQKFQEGNHRLVFFNATPQGGGVALMRHALIRLLRLLGIDASWHVMTARKDIFEITKTKFHNILQNVAPEDIRLTEEDKASFLSWSEENARALADTIKSATVIVIDDPQPSGMIPHIKKINPQAKLIYRSHIHLEADLAEQPGTPQYDTWQFLWQNIKDHDLFVSHPVDRFIPGTVSPSKTVTMPPATDPLDGLNKELSQQQTDYYLNLFNKILLEHHQTPLDRTRPYIVQIARFDPSKGITDVLESYKLLRAKMDKIPEITPPQLVIAGHGSIDDPDGVPIYSLTMNLLQQHDYKHLADDIKVARLPHNDQILNALIRAGHVALQLSHKEGFEIKVTEAIAKGKPVIAYKSGGIPLQVEDGQTGWLIEVGETEQVADRLYALLTDKNLYNTISKNAINYPNNHYFTVKNAANWLYLADRVTNSDLTFDKKENLMS